MPDFALHPIEPLVAIETGEVEGVEVMPVELFPEAIIDRDLKDGIGRTQAVGPWVLEHRHLDQEVIGLGPLGDQAVEGRLRSGGEQQIYEIVEHVAIADHHVVERARDELFGDLGVEDPSLGRQGRLAVDGERTPPSHLAHHIEGDVQDLETGGKPIAQGGRRPRGCR